MNAAEKIDAVIKCLFLALVITGLMTSPSAAAERNLERVRIAVSVKTVLEQEGKAQLPIDRVVDQSIVEAVLRERR